ncbi:MAG: hypothetical protein KA191_04585 [Verrucomicrobia bacterium]|jgi:hypothetical protein|nr:hypothetical protein [Verrucomicrobiota bacterium]OQC67076.1 MAG: hypothetical protein BWX48_01020 [Verrucomicrobia bacterium ADurb.Bin006]MDI9380906.1 hypothetical protein [Verrucomicrobiota bacterium]NMD21256.1 hypothetical protein [Verrucomicrobiota bacterium]HNU99020.1 hypothetical protein [Verrucomicrobiota bacterium]
MRQALKSLIASLVLASTSSAHPASLPSWDFTKAADRQGWQPTHDLGPITGSAEGMVLSITGSDPYSSGPVRDYPPDTPLWLHIRLKSDQGGMAQIFYFNTHATEENSIRFAVPGGGQWHDAKVRLPALGPSYRLRFDPPGTSGTCVLNRLRFEPRVAFHPPIWPSPAPPTLGPDAVTLESGDLKLIHGRGGLGEFEVHVAGQRLACGNNRALIGYVHNNQVRWFPYGYGADAVVTIEHQPLSLLADRTIGGAIRARAVCTDPDGARWQIEQAFTLNQAGALGASTRVSVDQDRAVLYLPVFTLLAGLGDFGTNKIQALLAGVEYLDNEPSSSTADLNPPASDRQVPDILKLTFPLMALAAQERYVGLAWNRDQPNTCAVFDSPDRFFGSQSHLMGLLFPGSDGVNREESSLLPYDTVTLAANRSVTVSALLLGGRGGAVVPAVQQYVRLFGLPPVPEIGMSTGSFFALAARGWLDSQIRDGNRYRHAAPGFSSGPSADAALYMDWLALKVGDTELAARLRTGAQAALALVSPANYNSAQVGHVTYPLPALIYGAVSDNAVAAQAHGNALLGRFQPDGSVHYQKPANGLDYGRTHWAPDANGLTAAVLESLLADALFSGNPVLRTLGLRHLRALDKFRNTVPRGAQTWEIPLHTPDILASAHLVRVYTIGFELTRDPDFLEQARYWAWTGVPFVYLTPPTSNPVGVYGTIPVLGATAWVAPNWIGLPVQWCGLVYADALYRFARHDPGGPWKRIADGIAAAGIQHCYPIDDPDFRGLLPDSYNLRSQTRNGPAINPATVLASAVRLLDEQPLYTFAAFNRHGLLVHAPGEITAIEERTDGVRFTVNTWSARSCSVLINGLTRAPALEINGQPVGLGSPHQFLAVDGRLILQVSGSTTVNLLYPAIARVMIERSAPQSVKVSWPARTSRATLEVAADLAQSSPWFNLPGPILSDGTSAYTLESPDASGKFYRLRVDL